MSEPEIARRCPLCGVSIREAARFCPQCGRALPPRDSKQPQPVKPALDDTIPLNTTAANPEDNLREAVRKATPVDSGKDPQKENQPGAQNEPVKAPAAERTSMGQAALGAVGAKIQRATTLARGVEDDVLDRARKVRKISSVVLDEAGYDPSLRFVLVAAVLFLLFLVIVLLNKLII